MSPDGFWPVEVEYDVRRTVYVEADTEAEAQSRALSQENWADAEQPEPRMMTLRLAKA